MRWPTRRGAARRALLVCLGLLTSACAPRYAALPQDDLLERFRAGVVELDCHLRCRYDFANGRQLLADGLHLPLVLGILRSGYASGGTWYLLGRAAEELGHDEAARVYYRESLSTVHRPLGVDDAVYPDLRSRLAELEQASEGTAEPDEPITEEREIVDASLLNVRAGPSLDAALVARLRRGAEIEVVEREGEWKQVRGNGFEGWVAGRYTRPTARPEDTAEDPGERAPTPATSSAPEPDTSTGPEASGEPDRSDPQARPAAEPKTGAVAAAGGRSGKRPSGERRAILGCPLPPGARLKRTSGAESANPTETYNVRASASQIIGFYDREMPRTGWRKTGRSSQNLLFFEKDGVTVAILVRRGGGAFTVMGA